MADGLTLVEPLANVVVKLPGVMAMVVAPFVDQLSLLLEPAFTVVGFAANEEIVGAEPLPGGGFTEDMREQLVSPRLASRIRSRARKLGGL